ncbi:PREDICTED: uncharacterized protein LOC106105971 isoform X2 [Papilio polytes]|uniref:uncharacterized protein LOC106105971 isoform X2 n=1 Tax=Papilio polytes TaxID=76194 RepID=UPI000675CE02|nr:PREDICTED: uncharacterized protein LOC106105971 isoform X2 [Papilio polytes]
MTSLSLFSFKTCLKFNPVLVRPTTTQHVMLFENPNGVRKCIFNTAGHSTNEPHRITLGYACLKSPQLEMMVMRALGFGFEHNRASRDIYIDVQLENIDSDAMELFAKDGKLPQELRPLKYDVNSVTHFGEREFSKNGHRTIIFKDNTVRQNRNGLSDTDLRKIDIIYGPECQKRDRQEKIDQCQNYPGVARRKRDIDLSAIGPSLRVNRDITAPPINKTELTSLDHLGIENEVKEILEKVYTVTSLALKNARGKYCNESNDIRSSMEPSDILGLVELVTDYAKSIVNHAVENITEFCEASNSIDEYHIARCGYFGKCKILKSTNFGIIRYSTNHRPHYPLSTNFYRDLSVYEKSKSRIGNETNEGTKDVRRKRSVTEKMQITQETSTINVILNTTETGQIKNVTETVTTQKDVIKELTVDIRRRFGDFRIHKQKKGEKPEIFESDLSLEAKEQVFKPTSKNRLTQKKKMSDNWAKEKRKVQEEPEAKSTPKTVQLSKENLEFYSERRWPDNVVPYYVKNSIKNYDLDKVKQRLEDVNRILKAETCVHLKEISEYEVSKYQDYLVVDQSPDYVTGRVGGKQNFGALELFEGKQHRQHAAMVVMSMLGFYFEPARHDRDKHIRVHVRHIRPDKLHHFEKMRAEATLPLPYDYQSATHPSWQFWRQIGS